jgi:hypothetical protein
MIRRALTTLAFIGIAAAAAWAEAAWLAGVEDLPLMPGLIERAEKSVVFDKPGGRIVEAEAIGRLERGAVEKFYAETLPALGWAPQGAGLYRRDEEVLRLDFGREGGATTIRFTINPGAARP